MNKFLLTTALAGAVVFTAAAEEGPKMSITGSIDSKFVNTHQKDAFRKVIGGANAGNKLGNNNISTDAYINFNIKGEVKDGLKYGGLIKLNANTSKSKKEMYLRDGENPSVAEQVMAFLESGYGRVEVGNYTGISESMKVNAGTFASATGGINGDAQYYWNAKTADSSPKYTKSKFVQTANLPTNELGTFGLRGANAAKLNYYTPEFSGFRFGATFIPNTKAFGTASQTTQILNNKEAGFKNVFEAGLSYTTEVKEVGVKLAAVSQFGKNQKVTGTPDKKHKNLRAFEVGTNLSYKGFTVGGSYGDWGKYDVAEADASEYGKTSYWTAGVGYANGPLSVSLTHLQSKRGDTDGSKPTFNKLRNTVLGVDYKVAPGILPYVEFASFKMNQASQTDEKNNNKGHIIMTGVKLNF